MLGDCAAQMGDGTRQRRVRMAMSLMIQEAQG
jgi:hypothetical protein